MQTSLGLIHSECVEWVGYIEESSEFNFDNPLRRLKVSCLIDFNNVETRIVEANELWLINIMNIYIKTLIKYIYYIIKLL